MKEISPWEVLARVRKVKARCEHTCYFCGGSIREGETYAKWVEPETGFERKIHEHHLPPEEEVRRLEEKMEECKRLIERGIFLEVQTDGSGPSGERWAFVIILRKEWDEKELVRQRGENELNTSPTVAEGVAVLRALKWLEENREVWDDGKIPLVFAIDNFPVAVKVSEGRTRGKFEGMWEEIDKLLQPYRMDGRLFVRGYPDRAHEYAQKF